MLGKDFGQGIMIMFYIAVIGIITILGIGLYSLYKYFTPEIIESKTIVKPDYRLVTDGKKIDTTYIYKFK